MPLHLTRQPLILVLVLISILTSGCTSYRVRQECEKTNWFAYGRSLAMSGQRISGDPVIRQCAMAEAEINEVALDRGFKSGRDNYCLPETVFQTGKKGEFFTAEMCDGEQPRFLKVRHAGGVKVFCQRVNGYPIGATGRKYNGICPKALEGGFLTGFNRGREAYLNASIANNEDELNDLSAQMRRAQSDRDLAEFQITSLGSAKIRDFETVVDPMTGESHQVWVEKDDASGPARRSYLQTQMNSAEGILFVHRAKSERLKKQNRDMRVELTALGSGDSVL